MSWLGTLPSSALARVIGARTTRFFRVRPLISKGVKSCFSVIWSPYRLLTRQSLIVSGSDRVTELGKALFRTQRRLCAVSARDIRAGVVRGAAIWVVCHSERAERAEIAYRHGDTLYRITVENPIGVCQGVSSLSLDGTPLADGALVPLVDDAREHQRQSSQPYNWPCFALSLWKRCW